jgi:hypothetical protein
MVAGSTNFINELLKLNLWENIYDKDVIQVAIEIVEEGDPDLCFVL